MENIPQELLGLIDTSVKVGLGALISALGAITLALINNSRVLEKERLTRRRDLLEMATQELQNFTNAALAYWAAASFFVENKVSQKEAENAIAELKKKQEGFR